MINSTSTSPMRGARMARLAAALVGVAVASMLLNGCAATAGARPTVTPTASAATTPSATPPDGGNDAVPIKVQLRNSTRANVSIDIVDGTGTIVEARSGQPGNGMSVEPGTVRIENVDAMTLRLTWVDFPVDNRLTLHVQADGATLSMRLVQPLPTRPSDSVGFDRVLELEFDRPVAAAAVAAELVTSE